MDTNLQSIARVADYIEAHLEDELDLDSLAAEAGYSKYHLHRMFQSIVGLPVHAYVQRRRLTEAARLLIFSRQPVLDIALNAGYETQQSFSVAFKAMFRRSPQAFRRMREFHPLQLPFAVDGRKTLRGDRVMEIRTEETGEIRLVGYCAQLDRGFGAIGRCWRKLHTRQKEIENRAAPDTLIGLNDYSAACCGGDQPPALAYCAAAEVAAPERVPKGMQTRVLPAGKYVVLGFRGNVKDSLEPVAAYIYGEWLPQSTCRLNENARYDFVKYAMTAGKDGMSAITYWIPVL